jgi:hypothetical protein
LAENGRLGSVSRAGFMGRRRALRGTHRGSGWRDGCRRGAHGSGARPRSFGEESHVREGWEEEEKGPAMLLTATRSSGGTCTTAESGGSAVRRAAGLHS